MELRFQAGGPESWSADAVIVFLSEDEKLEKAYPELLDAGRLNNGYCFRF